MSAIYKPASHAVDAASGDVVEIVLPENSRGHVFGLVPVGDFQVSFNAADAAADNGLLVGSGSVFTIDGPVMKSSIFIKQSTGSPASIRHAYLYQARQ